MPGLLADPPAMPNAPLWRPFDKIDAVIFSRKRTLRMPPSPPRCLPAPPEPELPLPITLKSPAGLKGKPPVCVLLHLDGSAEALKHPLAQALLDKGRVDLPESDMMTFAQVKDGLGLGEVMGLRERMSAK